MINSVSVQTVHLLYSALFGMAIGVLFDVVRLVRRCFLKKRFVTALADFVFWCIATASLLVFVLTVCDGKMRWYVLLGIFCGCFVYMAALSEIVYKVIACTVRLIRKLLYYTTRPLYFILRFIWRVFRNTGRKTEQGIRKKITEGKKRHRKKERAGKNGDKKKKKAQESVP